jgi:hypothetical protein
MINTSGNGIYGTGKLNNTTTNCYSANGNWQDTNAINNLVGIPINNNVGSIWVSNNTNTPFLLNNMGYSLYMTTNIVNNQTNQTYNVTLEPGQSSIPAIIPNKSYKIIAGNNNNFSINSNSGVITVSPNTPSDTYTLKIYNEGSYNITTVYIMVIDNTNAPCFTKDTVVLTPNEYINIDKLQKDDYVITSDGRKVKIMNIIKE